MGRLTDPAAINLEFRRVLEAEKLDDLSRFFRKGFFDEIPLYSRYSQLSFLGDFDRDRADGLIVRFSLDYLSRLVRHGTPSAEFLAAVTYNNYSKNEYLVPHIFVCHGEVDLLRGSGLVLKQPKSVFAIHLMGIVGPGGGGIQILQETVTVPRKPRVFIGPLRLPHPLMVGINVLSPARAPENGRATRV